MLMQGTGCQPQAAAQYQSWQAKGASAWPGGAAAPSAHPLADGAPPAFHLRWLGLQGQRLPCLLPFHNTLGAYVNQSVVYACCTLAVW